MPSMATLEDLRTEYFAEDVPIDESMAAWTENEAREYFDSGGVKKPGSGGAAALKGLFALPNAKLISGKELPWSEIAGKPVFMMNVASR